MKAQSLIFVTLCAVIFLFSCDRKKAQEPKDTPSAPTTETPQTDPTPDPKKDVYQVAGYQKTACFGKCPVYQVKFYSDGTVSWNGKMNVERMGMYNARVDESVLKGIKEKAFEVGFFDFQHEYPLTDKVVDLPSTITYIRVGDMEKIVRNTNDAPAGLEAFEKYLEEVIEKCRWEK